MNKEKEQAKTLNKTDVSKSLPNFEVVYSVRKLHSEINNICTCNKPNLVVDGGYCYASDGKGNVVRPCDIGVSLNYIANNADIKG